MMSPKGKVMEPEEEDGSPFTFGCTTVVLSLNSSFGRTVNNVEFA